MLYNTTVTAYTHKSFLFRVKKKSNVRRNQRGYETRTSRTLTGGHPPSTPSQWNEIIRAYIPLRCCNLFPSWACARDGRALIVMFGIALVRLLSDTFPHAVTHAQRASRKQTHSNTTRNCVCVCALVWFGSEFHFTCDWKQSHVDEIRSDFSIHDV